jgi:phosphate/sulfate permease
VNNVLIRSLIIGAIIGLGIAKIRSLAKKRNWSKTKEYATIIATSFIASFAAAILFPSD